MTEMEHKRQKLHANDTNTNALDTSADFVAFDENDHNDYQAAQSPTDATTGIRAQSHPYRRREDSRNKYDRPKSKHPLLGMEPWILVKTKFGRRFVHNLDTKESFWRIPQHVRPGVEAFDIDEEKQKNAQWAEEQLRQMRAQQVASSKSESQNAEPNSRRRRSESLQREDEQALLAELAAQETEDQGAAAVKAIEASEPKGYVGYASDSEYEYVEVTDDEGEDDEREQEQEQEQHVEAEAEQSTEQAENVEDEIVEFGEDDIAHQLAMMGEDYGLDPEEYGDDEDIDEDQRGLELSTEEAESLFRQMLGDHGVSPFTPWDKLLADETDDSIIFDSRYTLLGSSKARKDAWSKWSRDEAAAIQQQRELEKKERRRDPKVEYLVFLSSKADVKLYWPEFKRKFKREPEMNERGLQEKDREKLYRDFVAKLKLPESKRQGEVEAIFKTTKVKQDQADGMEKLATLLQQNASYHALPLTRKKEILKKHGYTIEALNL